MDAVCIPSNLLCSCSICALLRCGASYEIDRLASESSSTANEDSVDKEASIDHGKVLSYLQTRLTSTPLSIYFSNEVTSAKLKPKLVEDGLPVLEELECQLKRQEQGLSYIEKLPHVDMLLANLTDRASSIFSQIAKAEMRNVLFGEPQEIGSARSGTPMDMQCLEVVSNYPRLRRHIREDSSSFVSRY